ncbi:MAG: hypothetical protein EP305_13175 [Bacteroidetes bacterium]|nr:MAG: hypothetical protein EP305_13175 [Bacteroidota bacterium]
MNLNKVYFLLILIGLFSCRKKEFTSCPNFEKVVGEWQCIDTETKDKLIVQSDGTLIVYFNMERSKKYRHTFCEFKGSNLGYFVFFKNSDNPKYMNALWFKSSFDTLVMRAGTYNQSLENVGDERRYIKAQ